MKKFSKKELIELFKSEYNLLYNKGITSVIPINDLPNHLNVITLLYEYLDDNSKYLDVSIGSGFISRVLRKSGIDITGVDGIFFAESSEEHEEKLRECIEKFEPYGIKYIERRIEEEGLPFEDNEFDVIYWGATIEHLHNSPKFPMDEMYRVLKPSGKFIITTPNIISLKHRLLLLFGITFMPSIEYVYNSSFHASHHREYTMQDLIKVCKWTGYNILHYKYVDTFWPLSLKKIGKLASKRTTEAEKSKFTYGFNCLNWYDYIKLIPMIICKIFPTLRETLVVVCEKP